jgi:hypothetical protein
MRVSDNAAVLLAIIAAVLVGAAPAEAQGDGAWKRVETALGRSGAIQPGDVIKFSFPRSDLTVTATAINFQPTGGRKAAITGDFVLRASEVNPVLRALRDHGIQVTALHSHMIDEEPRLLFMHFWANDDAVSLAKGLRTALDPVGKK